MGGKTLTRSRDVILNACWLYPNLNWGYNWLNFKDIKQIIIALQELQSASEERIKISAGLECSPSKNNPLRIIIYGPLLHECTELWVIAVCMFFECLVACTQ